MDKDSLLSAVRDGKLPVVIKLIKSSGPSFRNDGCDLLLVALRKKHEDIARLLLLNDCQVNGVDGEYYSYTPLHYAATYGYVEIVEMLLDRNAEIDARDEADLTSLCRAVENNQIEIVRLLLNRKACVNAKNKTKTLSTTALHMAAHGGHEEIVDILLKYGAEVDSIVGCDMTPLHVAAQSGHSNIVESLLKFGADIDKIDEYGRTALHIACLGCHADVVVALLRNGSDINIISKDCNTLLDYPMFSLTYSYYFTHLCHRHCPRACYRNFRYMNRGHLFENPCGDINDDEYCIYVDEHQGILDYPDEICKIILRHIAKMMVQKLFVDGGYLCLISEKAHLKCLYDDIEISMEMDFTKMKNKKIGNTNISFYDVLTRDVHQLAIYAKNRNIVDVFESCEYKNMFPSYADILENRFKNGQEREGLLNSSIKSFISLFGYEVPHLFIDKMFSYLSNLDLKNLADACPHDTVIEC